jgi:energy-coupling factor transporter ATP-binding protein EcfA2
MNISLSKKEGEPIFTVKGGKDNGKKFRLDIEYSGDKPIRDYKAPAKSQIIPCGTKTRRCDFIFGPSGSGKSTLAANKIIKPYKKKHPNFPFYLISPKTDDEVLNRLNPNRIEINYDNFVDDPITLEELGDAETGEGSIVLFDDCESIGDPILRKAVDSLRDQILIRGRSMNISCITINHLNCNGYSTRILLTETICFHFFPGCGSPKFIVDILTRYCNLDKEQIKKIITSKNTRSVCVHMRYPNYVMTDSEFYLL